MSHNNQQPKPGCSTAIVSQAGLGDFGTFLKSREAAVGKICASHVNPARATRVMLACVARTPALQDCTMGSLAMVMMQSAELGLECGSALGEAYAVPYRNNKKNCMEAQFIPGYRGLICLAYRSGAVQNVQAHVVCEGDEFEFEYGLHPKLRHVPVDEVDPSKITHAYCVVHIKDADPTFDVMTRKDIDRIRARSKAGGSGPWVSDYAEMARKTVTRRALKYAPMSIEMSKAIAADVAADTGDFSVMNEFDTPIDADFIEEQNEDKAQTHGVNAVKSKLGIDTAAPTENDETTTLRNAVIADLTKMNAAERKALLTDKLGDTSIDNASHDQLLLLAGWLAEKILENE